MNRIFLAALAAAALSIAPPAQAQGRGYHEHDGFYLHLELGGGGFKSSASEGGNKAEFSGGAGEFAIGLGGALTPNFILAGQLWGATVSSPTYKFNGVSQPRGDNTSVSLSGIGLELTYYFMPLDLYLTAVPSIGTLSAEANGTKYETKSGFAIKLAVGKEWWVSDNWGLGLNLQYAHGSNKDKGTPSPTWGTDWYGVAFSATYN